MRPAGGAVKINVRSAAIIFSPRAIAVRAFPQEPHKRPQVPPRDGTTTALPFSLSRAGRFGRAVVEAGSISTGPFDPIVGSRETVYLGWSIDSCVASAS
jgi:hypothetical protein